MRTVREIYDALFAFAPERMKMGDWDNVGLLCGRFSTEVETVLSLLKILDNPYWDIPLTAVLHSPMFGFTDRELAEIRGRQEGSFAHVFFDWARTHSREKKVEKFLSSRTNSRSRWIGVSATFSRARS